MIGSIDRHRPRRFFGLRGVVRSLRRSRDTDAGRPRDSPSTHLDRALQSERARFAAKIDLELRLTCRSEATMRRELGEAARAFVSRRAYRRMGFVRLSDYARERLGVSARTLESAVWFATRLDALPAVARAYDRSEISWTQARAICKVAVAADEAQWLATARRSTVETLERLTARARQPDSVPKDPEGDANAIDGEPAVRWRFVCPVRLRALWRHALELASRAAGEPLSDWRAAEVVAAEGSSGRPVGGVLGDRMLMEAVRLARRARRNVRHADDSKPAMSTTGSTDLRTAVREGVNAGIAADRPVPADSALPVDRTPAAPPRADPSADFAPAAPAPPSDPFALEARLVEAMRVLRTIEPRIGRLLRVVIDQRIYRLFGYPTFADYARERLGISARKAWALLKVEKATMRSAEFDDAYRDGRLSWVRALSLLPVLDRQNAPAWIARAENVTVRRLNDEVEWVLTSRDALGSTVSLAPPPIDSPLRSPVRVMTPEQCRDLSSAARLQIRAHGIEPTTAVGERQFVSTSPPAAGTPSVVGSSSVPGSPVVGSPSASGSPWAPSWPLLESEPRLEVCDAEIRFTGPASVVALLRDVLDSFADPAEPRWIALERLLRHVITHWESTPRHHDPVFARDRWRCTVPACSARRNLHDHHIRFRSRGGDNERDNRTTVCAAHHLHGIHDGTIRAAGTAPNAIEWQLGVRPGATPFLTFVGDRYASPETSDARFTHAKASALP